MNIQQIIETANVHITKKSVKILLQYIDYLEYVCECQSDNSLKKEDIRESFDEGCRRD